jgi:hypothetical protein
MAEHLLPSCSRLELGWVGSALVGVETDHLEIRRSALHYTGRMPAGSLLVYREQVLGPLALGGGRLGNGGNVLPHRTRWTLSGAAE